MLAYLTTWYWRGWEQRRYWPPPLIHLSDRIQLSKVLPDTNHDPVPGSCFWQAALCSKEGFVLFSHRTIYLTLFIPLGLRNSLLNVCKSEYLTLLDLARISVPQPCRSLEAAPTDFARQDTLTMLIYDVQSYRQSSELQPFERAILKHEEISHDALAGSSAAQVGFPSQQSRICIDSAPRLGSGEQAGQFFLSSQAFQDPLKSTPSSWSNYAGRWCLCERLTHLGSSLIVQSLRFALYARLR